MIHLNQFCLGQAGRKWTAHVTVRLSPAPLQGLKKLIALSNLNRPLTNCHSADVDLAQRTGIHGPGFRKPNFVVSHDNFLRSESDMSVARFAMPAWQLEFPAISPPRDTMEDPLQFGKSETDSGGGQLIPCDPDFNTAQKLHACLEKLAKDHGKQGNLWLVHDFIRCVEDHMPVHTPCMRNASLQHPLFVFGREGSIPCHLEFPWASHVASDPSDPWH